jgi:hypothetical protein
MHGFIAIHEAGGKPMTVLRLAVIVAVVMLAAAPSAAAVESPPTGIHPSEFATQYSGCLGKLRGAIARGELAGVGPFGRHFTGDVNPGAHQGTVGEEEFLRALGITDLAGFCAQFE